MLLVAVIMLNFKTDNVGFRGVNFIDLETTQIASVIWGVAIYHAVSLWMAYGREYAIGQPYASGTYLSALRGYFASAMSLRSAGQETPNQKTIVRELVISLYVIPFGAFLIASGFATFFFVGVLP